MTSIIYVTTGPLELVRNWACGTFRARSFSLCSGCCMSTPNHSVPSPLWCIGTCSNDHTSECRLALRAWRGSCRPGCGGHR